MKKTLIIAEIGCNHNGNYNLAIKSILAAKKSGADAVKFQIFDPKNLVTKNAKKAPYSNSNKNKQTQYDMQKSISLHMNKFERLKKFANKKKIKFLCSAFDLDSLNYLKKIKLSEIKIPSGEINNIQYLKYIRKFAKKVIISTGMSTIEEIDKAYKIINKKITSKNIAILHCVSIYPTDIEKLNLNNILMLKKRYNLKIGLSDHTTSLFAPSIAVALGAEIIEKHFTINKNLKGPDHFMSLNPSEFKKMVSLVRSTERSMGSYKRILTKKELELKKYARKSVVAKNLIKKGEIFSLKNLTLKRPGNGMEPKKIYNLIGKKSKKNYKMDQLINE